MRGLILIILILSAPAAAWADCKNPESEKRDTYSADSFLEYQAKFKERVKQLIRGSNSKPERASINSSAVYETISDYDYAAKLGMGFSEGLGAVVVDRKFGFINAKGEIVIKPQFTFADCFSEGFSAVEAGDKWGFVDRSGKVSIQPQFDFAFSFSEGLALVKVGKLWGYIDKNGRFAIEPKFEEARSFSEDMAAVVVYDKDYVWTTHERANGKWRWGFIDKNGNWALPPNFDVVHGDFSRGMALVSRDIGYKNGVIAESYFIDKKGTELWVLDSALMTWFSDDMIVITTGRDRDKNRELYSFLDRNGRRPTAKSFFDLCAFSEGLAVACEDERCGFIDKKGEYVIKPVFSGAHSFSEGLAAVYDDNKIGFVDKSGSWAIKPTFNRVGYFSEGKAAVAIDGKFGYIDKTGKYIWKPAK